MLEQAQLAIILVFIWQMLQILVLFDQDLKGSRSLSHFLLHNQSTRWPLIKGARWTGSKGEQRYELLQNKGSSTHYFHSLTCKILACAGGPCTIRTQRSLSLLRYFLPKIHRTERTRFLQPSSLLLPLPKDPSKTRTVQPMRQRSRQEHQIGVAQHLDGALILRDHCDWPVDASFSLIHRPGNWRDSDNLCINLRASLLDAVMDQSKPSGLVAVVSNPTAAPTPRST